MRYWAIVRSGWLDLTKFSFRAFMDRDEVDVNKIAKKIEVNLLPSWPNMRESIKDLLHGLKENFFLLRDQRGKSRAGKSGSQSGRRMRCILPAGGTSLIITGHFPVAPSLCFKARLSATLLIWKCFSYSNANKTHFNKNGFGLCLVFESEFLELANCLLLTSIKKRKKSEFAEDTKRVFL